MSEPQQGNADLVIGIDAGGTKTTAWLANFDFETSQIPLGRGSAGPGNPRAIGFRNACQNIQAAIADAFQDARIPQTSVLRLCLCVAGAGREEEQEQLKDWATKRHIATSLIVTDDAQPILAAVSQEQIGIVLISGTGSFAWGRNLHGETVRSGGWGYLFGDEGSGYRIALAGLQAAAKAADDRGPETELLPAFLEHFAITEPAGLIGKIYGEQLNRQEVAALSKVVFHCSQDAVASRILDEAVHELSGMVEAVATNLGLILMETQLALAGGVFIHQPQFVSQLLRQWGLSRQHVEVVTEPVSGAVNIALHAEQNS